LIIEKSVLSSRRLAGTWPYERRKKFEDELREAAANWFRSKGFKTHPKMDYCLADRDKQWKENIILPEVAEYINGLKVENRGTKPFPLHKYLHHGLSSQAMAFNLLGPLKERDDFEPLKIALGKQGFEWPTNSFAEFEYEDRAIFNEDTGQPTSIDFAVIPQDGQGSIFIEVKLSESEFGGCSVFANGDCDGRNPFIYGLEECYLHHLGRKYWDVMKEHGLAFVDFNKGSICPFTCYYQFYREVLFALVQGGSYILLHDERNPAFYQKPENHIERGLYPFMLQSLPKGARKRVGRITLQQVAQAIEESGRHGDWIGEFRNKYGL
jgi:POLQ-like helicase